MITVSVVGVGQVYAGNSQHRAEKALKECEEKGEAAILWGHKDEILAACNIRMDFPH